MSLLLALFLSHATFAADWQCGDFKNNHLALESDSYNKYSLVPANEATDDFLKGFTGARLCVKGRVLIGIHANMVIYDVKAE